MNYNSITQHSTLSLIQTVHRSIKMIELVTQRPDRYVCAEQFLKRAKEDQQQAETELDRRGMLAHPLTDEITVLAIPNGISE